ncbi:MAG: NAD(P)-dependent glycerol-1-phosphate dehydrogenase [Hadesarchaea archaeon]|nr:NAD(P)-dependent glycerol-1-phosphate dehydrogenase [Hadesarchaea archaeon]
MKEPKFMELPREVWMGPGVLGKIVSVCQRLPLGEKALVVDDPKTYKIAGERICRLLRRANFDVEHVEIRRADMETVKTVQELTKNGVAFLIGVGGGTCIDVAKFASFRERKPYISVPTAATHDGIASSRASIKGRDRPTSIKAQAPIAIVADTLIIKRAPHRLLAAGCGDVIANYSAVYDWELAFKLGKESYSEYAAALSKMSAKLVMKNAEIIGRHTEESVRKVVKALISSGVAMSIAGSSRPASGSEHLFSHALDMIAPRPALHGEQCGVGAIMMTCLQGNDWRPIRDALKKIGAPTNAEELGIEPKYIIEALTIAHEIRPERYTVLRDGLDAREAERLAKETGVI